MSEATFEEPDATPLGLFAGFGIEIEYMIVDRETLSVRPVADRLMEAVTGKPSAEAEFGSLAWSNELALHVLELKTNGPATTLAGVADSFHEQVVRANGALADLGCVLLPGGVHPWMDPDSETRLWPHEYTDVYRALDRIFSCRGHGWSNLQSTHLNLPFSSDFEFGALHAAVRALLPLLPALAASSPFLEGNFANALDRRMIEYRANSNRIPSVAGIVVPEPVGSRSEYERDILAPIYNDLAPLDTAGTLCHEWVNGRGAIARFERGTVEIRVMDPQECPAADLAVVRAVARTVQDLCERVLDGHSGIGALSTERLASILDGTVYEADHAIVDDRDYLEALGVPRPGRARRAADLWIDLFERSAPREWEGPAPLSYSGDSDPLEVILERGCLARRLLDKVGASPGRARLVELYGELSECLEDHRLFLP